MFNLSRDNTSIVAKWWRNIDRQILFLFIFLLLLGLFFSFSSITSVMSEKMNKQTYFFFIRHLVFVSISLFLLFAISIQKKEKLIKFLTYLFIASLVLLFLTLVVGVEIKGSRRSMGFDPLPRFQPIELVKPLFIIFIGTYWGLYAPCAFSFPFRFSLLLLEPEVGPRSLQTGIAEAAVAAGPMPM